MWFSVPVLQKWILRHQCLGSNSTISHGRSIDKAHHNCSHGTDYVFSILVHNQFCAKVLFRRWTELWHRKRGWAQAATGLHMMHFEKSLRSLYSTPIHIYLAKGCGKTLAHRWWHSRVHSYRPCVIEGVLCGQWVRLSWSATYYTQLTTSDAVQVSSSSG